MPQKAPTWALDLDGVVWLARKGIPGSAEAVDTLRRAGKRVVFLTNNSGPLLDAHVEALAQVGIPCQPEDLVTSAQAAASMVGAGERVYLIGDEGVTEALTARRALIVGADERPDVVMVGRKTELDYWALAAASRAIREGARFLATNTDATFPTGGDGTKGDDGLVPGAGALVAFIATAAGRQPQVAGKPHSPTAALVRARYGQLEMMVGDRPDTDGLFARRVGTRFGLVLSGVTRASDLPVEPHPDLVADDLRSLVELFLEPATG